MWGLTPLCDVRWMQCGVWPHRFQHMCNMGSDPIVSIGAYEGSDPIAFLLRGQTPSFPGSLPTTEMSSSAKYPFLSAYFTTGNNDLGRRRGWTARTAPSLEHHHRAAAVAHHADHAVALDAPA